MEVALKTSKLCGLEYLPPNLLVILLQGLGRKKISPEKRQHVSRNFNLWACDYVPSCLDGFSNNQISYVYKEAVVVPIFRRFPRHHHEIWNTFKFMPQQSYTEFWKKNPKVRFLINKKTSSPLTLPEDPWCFAILLFRWTFYKYVFSDAALMFDITFV